MFPGSVRNWWAGLEAITLLFIKEHNYLCGELRKARPPSEQCTPVAPPHDRHWDSLANVPACTHAKSLVKISHAATPRGY